MPKPRNPILDYSVCILVRVGICILQALPLGAAVALADVLAWLAYHADRRHCNVARDNLRYSFPERSEVEIDRCVRAVYRHYCRLIVEIAWLPRKLHVTNWRHHVDLPQSRLLVHWLTADRPLLFVTGHFGNWELGGWVLGRLGFRTHAIARPLDNPFLDDFLRRFREGTGQKLLAKKGDFEQMQAILAAGGVIATIADQDAGQRGLFVDFFHRPASTHKAVALLSLEYQVPLLVIGVKNLGRPLRYAIIVEDVILPEEYAGRPGAVKEITQRFTLAIERMIRTAPEQYLWLHRRWKHQPVPRKKTTAA